MAHHWDPQRYLAYGEERTRPFADLLARVGAERPRRVVDLGCGPGTATALLAHRWPGADVLGLDSSPEMVERARGLAGVPGVPEVRWEVGDLRQWAPAEPVDVVVSNATFQWVPGHLDLLPALLRHVVPGGWFAFQVPGNHDEPSHRLLREIGAEPRFAAYTAGVARPFSHRPADYLEALLGAGCRQVDVWETTYLHLLPGEDAVLDWVSGTGARPTLQSLPEELRDEFEASYRRALRTAYPRSERGTLLPFRRVFAVARVAGGTA